MSAEQARAELEAMAIDAWMLNLLRKTIDRQDREIEMLRKRCDRLKSTIFNLERSNTLLVGQVEEERECADNAVAARDALIAPQPPPRSEAPAPRRAPSLEEARLAEFSAAATRARQPQHPPSPRAAHETIAYEDEPPFLAALSAGLDEISRLPEPLPEIDPSTHPDDMPF